MLSGSFAPSRSGEKTGKAPTLLKTSMRTPDGAAALKARNICVLVESRRALPEIARSLIAPVYSAGRLLSSTRKQALLLLSEFAGR